MQDKGIIAVGGRRGAEAGAGETLEEIYNTVAEAVSSEYFIERRRSALRLRSNDGQQDTHIDLVPGRYFDATRTDAWIYQNNAEKCRLKTNLDIHIAHIRDSGLRPAIRLAKLWNVWEGVRLKTFVLELLIIKLLEGRKGGALTSQLERLFEQFRCAGLNRRGVVNERVTQERSSTPS